MARNYTKEYDKFQDSADAIKKRTALNRMNYKKGTYGNNDGLDVSHTEDGIRLEKSSINKGRKEKSRMKGSKRKQQGGYLKGKSHKQGGIPAIIAGQEPVELEGGEYIIKKSSVDKLGKSTLEHINKKGRIPTMATGGKTKNINEIAKQLGISAAGLEKLQLQGRKKGWRNKEAMQATPMPGIKGKRSKAKAMPRPKTTGPTKAMPMANGGKIKYQEGGGAYGIGKWFKSLGDKAMAKKEAKRKEKAGKAVVGKKGKQQLTDDADKWTFGEKLTKKGREKWKRRITSKKAVKTLQGIDADKVTTVIKGPDKIKQTKEALKHSGKIKKKDVKGAVITKGGMYPEYGKKTKSAGKFRDAFKAARKEGKKTFEWQGRKYTSETAEEKKARTTPKDAPEMQMGGRLPIQPQMGDMPHRAPMRTYKHGGQTSVTNSKAGTGDIVTTYSHSGYKAGE